MSPTHNAHDGPVEEGAPGAGPNWGHLPHGQLTNAIIGALFEVHNVLCAGFLESVYANALTVELRLRGVPVERNVSFEVMYRGTSVGRYVADLVVDQTVIVETKVAKAIDPVHRAQLFELPTGVGSRSRARRQFRKLSAIQACRLDPTGRPASRRGRV